jgi:(p)ppGpp synthase/HD superfamily hydrolase
MRTIEFYKALTIAAANHGTQQYRDEPYWIHCLHVADVAWWHGATSEGIQIACALHDILEDTDIKPQDLKDWYPAEILLTVREVTDDPRLTREEQLEAQAEKFLTISLDAVTVKLADIVANFSVTTDGDLERKPSISRNVKAKIRAFTNAHQRIHESLPAGSIHPATRLLTSWSTQIKRLGFEIPWYKPHEE